MSDLELFLHDERDGLPLLVKAGLVHVQFETIHPFLDGNGRLGRLLITFLLCAAGVLREPILYLSLYFKEHRSAYYDLLDRVRAKGEWETWLEFFLAGVRDTAEQAAAAARRILVVFDDDHRKIEALGRPAASVLRVFEHLQRNPIVSIPATAHRHLGADGSEITGPYAAARHASRDHREATPSSVCVRRLPRHPERGNRTVSVSPGPIGKSESCESVSRKPELT
jgi:hypothetical protein